MHWLRMPDNPRTAQKISFAVADYPRMQISDIRHPGDILVLYSRAVTLPRPAPSWSASVR